VGGDYFDFFPYDDGRIGLVLGDVSGKGMPAALLMTALKGGVQVLLGEAPQDVSSLMSRLDRVVAANFPRNRFVSLFFGLLDPASGEMIYCNAGHNPPFLLRAEGGIERLPSCGTILGIFPELGYDVKRCRLEPGDVLTLFSDGVTEENNPSGEEFGEERLSRLLIEKGPGGAVNLVEGIRLAVLAWAAGAAAADDVTVVVARRVP
jgi:serine phosphatase RsbU (regulator of sigma subunit)